MLAVEPEEVSDEPCAVLPDPLGPELIAPLPEGEVEAVESVVLPELMPLLEGEAEVEGLALVLEPAALWLVSLAATLFWPPVLPVVVGR